MVGLLGQPAKGRTELDRKPQDAHPFAGLEADMSPFLKKLWGLQHHKDHRAAMEFLEQLE
ncbi:MAG: hypothetical protein Q9166_004737, partial [cf. Caloplaca sp. 2 TL-2023]